MPEISNRKTRRQLRRAIPRSSLQWIERHRCSSELAEFDAALERIPDDYAGPTTMQRLDVLHERLDAVLLQCGQQRRAGLLYRKTAAPAEAA
jgi:hypothetical protein